MRSQRACGCRDSDQWIQQLRRHGCWHVACDADQDMMLFVVLLLLWLSLALMLVGILGRAFALTLLWAWFVVPTFGAEPLSLPVAAGLITLTYLVFSPKRDPTNLRVARDRKDEGEEDKSTLRESMQSVSLALLHELATPAFAIALGWVLKQAAGI
jgi:hypothetical protein